MRFKCLSQPLAALIVCSVVTSQAALLPPGGSTVPDVGSLAGASPAPGVQNIVTDFSFLGLQGEVWSSVWTGASENPYGGLTFVYKVLNEGSVVIDRFTASQFFGDVEVRYATIVAAEILPSIAERVINHDTIGWEFNSGIPVGVNSQSAFLIVHTAATAYQYSWGVVTDTHSANVQILAPVPEPATMIAGGLLLLPFAASTIRILRKRMTA